MTDLTGDTLSRLAQKTRAKVDYYEREIQKVLTMKNPSSLELNMAVRRRAVQQALIDMADLFDSESDFTPQTVYVKKEDSK